VSHFRFDLVFNEDIALRRMGRNVEACCCKTWRSVRAMLRYYGRDAVTVFKVRWQPTWDWKHDKRKPTPREVAEYLDAKK
jgi:hypothetical protein